MVATSSASQRPAGGALNIALWISQGFIFVAFVTFGVMKLFMPVKTLAAMWIWPGQVPLWFLHLMGILDAAGGIGVFLPALTRIAPRLTVIAALCCVLLQIAAIIFHASRGEFVALPINIVLLALVSFIFWGRRKIPILPRA